MTQTVTKTRAAVLHEPGKPWDIVELDIDPPKDNEVLVKFKAAGLCHSDEHIRSGDHKARLPMVGGHEGSGVVVAAGSKVTRVAEGDHIVCSFIPVCGTCRYCMTGRSSLCDRGLYAGVGCLPDQTFRFHENGEDVGGICVLGTFSEYAVLSEWSVTKINDWLPFDVAALVGCGVTTGWGSAVYASQVRAGDTVVVFGIGGVGINAVQGSRFAGAKYLVAIDPVPFKLEMAEKVGATHTFSDPDEAQKFITEVTWGQGADHAILTVGVMTADVVDRGIKIVGKGGTITITGIPKQGEITIAQNSAAITGWQKRIQGTIFGSSNPLYDIPKLLGLWESGHLMLNELITKRYRLEEVNQGFQDMLDGKNIRGVIVYDD
ncbi:MAG TPA: NDMA-dependent alcohol dehydrogenase [Acidimicrobiales bacterium]|nr:NDMA-dependent alcohol dehydrogenase [Acidimicrobiales bacterium]